MLKFEGIDYDLNYLFQFEMLKKLIEAIAKSQIQTNEKLESVIKMPNQYPICNSTELGNDEVQSDKEEKEDELGEEKDLNNAGSLSGVNKRILAIERKLNTVKTLDKQIKASINKTDNLNDQLIQTIKKVAQHDNDISSNTKEIAEIKETLEDIRNKMSDYNMYETLKDSSEGGASNQEISKGTILNLETKIFKKLNWIDERNKKSEEENLKTKAEVLHIKNTTEVMSHQIHQFNEDLNKKLEEYAKDKEIRENELSEQTNQRNEDINTKLKQLEEINERMNNKFKEIEDNFMKTINSISKDNKPSEEDNKQNKADQEKELRYIKDLNKRVIELEKGIRSINSSLIFDEIKEEISQLQDSMRKRLVKNDLSDINDKIMSIESVISDIKDTNEIQQNSINSHSTELSSMSKKIENLIGVIISMQDGGGNSPGYSAKPLIDFSKYVEMNLFNTEINNIKNYLKELSIDSDEYRRKINDLMPLLISAAKTNDIKTLEKLIVGSIAEANQANIKRYADKNEMSKKLKTIDLQLKQTIIKKNDKSEHCMLASKPFTGFKCASCENEIEDLNNKLEYLPWKKYPLKNFADQSYRMGNGFSRILQKMSLEMTRVNEYGGAIALSDSDDEKKKRNSSEEKSKRQLSKIKNTQLGIDEFKGPYVHTEHSELKGNKLNSQDKKEREPKVIKIYKKIKQVNDDFNISNKNINEDDEDKKK